MRTKEFNTGLTDKKLVEKIISTVKKNKKKEKEGEEFLTINQIAESLNLSIESIDQVMKAHSDAEDLDGGKFVLSGKSWVLENGNIGRFYCRAGELMVQCIEDAYKDELNFHVPITGEYLVGRTWGDAH